MSCGSGKIPKYKYFSNVRYTKSRCYVKKQSANKLAKSKRDQGHNARVVTIRNYKGKGVKSKTYCVYIMVK